MRKLFSQSPAPLLASFLAATLLLLAPAIWNGFPFLFYDSGAYLARPFDGTSSPGRSMVYGLWLALGRFPYFWPVAIAQSAISVWIIYLVLRTHGLAGRRMALPVALLGIIAFLATATALPWFAGQLMPDLFAALGVLALHLLLFRGDAVGRYERFGLIALIAFAVAAHNATLAVIAGLLLAAAAIHFTSVYLIPRIALKRAVLALLLGIALVPSANLAFTGQFAWTPGGSGFVFSRLVQDGIVARYLADNCPDKTIKLCKFRKTLPKTADDFLWHQGAKGAFVGIGGFVDGAPEMTRITFESLSQYPTMHVATAIRTMAEQFVSVRSGDGIVHNVWDAYGTLERLTPEVLPQSHTALQRQNQLRAPLTWINYFHVPITLGSMTLLPLLLLLAWRRGELRDTDLLAATLLLAMIANAFVTGVLSNPHDRYGARIAWAAPFLISLVIVQMLVTSRAWQLWTAERLVSLGLLPKPAAVPVRSKDAAPANLP